MRSPRARAVVDARRLPAECPFFRRALALVLWLLMGISISVPASAQESAELQPVRLALKWRHQFQFAGYYAAMLKGFYREEGFDVTLIEGGMAGESSAERLLRGEVEFAVTGPEILRYGQRRYPPLILAAIFQHAPDVFLFRADQGMSRLQDFVGRKVMVDSIFGEALLRLIMSNEGLDPKQVQITSHSYNLEDLIQGRIEVVHAYATVEPGLLARRGVETRMITPADYGAVFYGDLLVTRQDLVFSSSTRVEAFRRASLKGWNWALSHVDDMIQYIKTLPGVADRSVDEAFLRHEAKAMHEMIRHDLVPIGHINRLRWDRMAEQLVQTGLASEPPLYENWVYHTDHAVHQRWIQFLVIGWVLLLGGAGVFYYSRRQLREVIRRRTQNLEDEVRQRLEREERLRESEKQFASLFWENPECLAVTRRVDGRMMLVNKGFETLFEGTRAEIEGRTSVELGIWIAPDDRARVIEALGKQGVLRSHETRLRTLRGREFPALVSVVPYEYQHEESLLWIVMDITQQRQQEIERRRYEQQVQHVQRLESLGIMAGGIAHDFNNLLTGILGNIELAAEGVVAEGSAREALADIRVAALRASDLTRQLLAYSGKGRLEDRPLDLNALVGETVQLLRLSISKKADLRLNLADRPMTVRGDAAQIRQVLMNLVMNASDALEGRVGEIVISSRHEDCATPFTSEFQPGVLHAAGRYAVIAVADSGCGIEESARQKIFEPFYTTKFTGRGLGLAAVLGIVRGHRGSMQIDSRVGQGTTVKVLFPVTEEMVSSEQPPQATREETTMERKVILVADDEELVRKLARAMLDKAGYEVAVVEDGALALDELRRRQGNVDLIILDMTMPRLNGEETFRQIQKEFPGKKVILASGYSEAELMETFTGERPVAFLGKPFEKDELLAKVTAALAG